MCLRMKSFVSKQKIKVKNTTKIVYSGELLTILVFSSLKWFIAHSHTVCKYISNIHTCKYM